MTELPSHYNPKVTEDRIYKMWLKSGKFKPENLGPKKKKFVVMMPPPNITGGLHAGHFLENSMVDAIVRHKRMNGYKTLWLPGIDHAGISTQNVVEKELKKQGLTRHQLGREKFIKKVWEWKEKYGGIILEQLKKTGISCDWSRAAFTLDKSYAEAVKQVFIHYYKNGWIYRAQRVINWCPRCSTSLSDLELEYKEEKTKLWYIRYKIKNDPTGSRQKRQQKSKIKEKEYITVATTRPETMLGDTAVAVNPKDGRYKDLIGKIAILPIIKREIPIIADPLIEKNFGTGAVKVTPAHDLIDEEIGKRHNLSSIQVIGNDGKMTEAAGQEFASLTVLEARQKVLEILKREELIGKTEDYVHNLSVCYRCGTPIEPIPSWQWFLKMKELAELAKKAVQNKKIAFVPLKWNKPYFAWLNNIRDWCISRQIWWGHQLPVFFCSKKLEEISNSKIQNPKNENFVVAESKPKKCPICGKCEMEQSEDVLDTWFSSALWPFATLGWPKKTKDLKEYYPNTFMTSARDILHLWITRMIFSGMEFMKKEPFQTVYIHPLVLTKEGRRMSKSLGTGMDPLILIEKYGADASRFGILWQARGNQDIHFSEEHVVAGKKFANKIWNAARFVLLSQNGKSQFLISKSKINSKFQMPNSKLTAADKKITTQLKKTIKEVDKNIENYRFGQALQIFYDFFWHKLCDQYIEISKKQLQELKTKASTQKVLFYVLKTSLITLHPFMPFITEEIYQKLPMHKKTKWLMIENWPC